MKIYKVGNKKKNIYAKKAHRLPSSYMELFFDTIKQNWRNIIFIGFFFLLFFLPVLISWLFNDLYFISLFEQNLDVKEIDALRISGRNFFNIFACVGVIFSCIGISGVSRLNLLISREEGYFFFADFNKGVRENIKNNFVFILIYGVLLYFSLLVLNSLNPRNILIYFPFAMVQTIFFPLVLINISTTSIYSWNIKDSFRNALFIYIRNFLPILGFSLAFSSILLLNLMGHHYFILKYILFALIIVLVLPIIALAFRVFLNKVLDRDINKKHYPEIYKKGIFEEQEDEYLNNVVTKFYTLESKYSSISNDPYLDEYTHHLCALYENGEDYKNKFLVGQNTVWPTNDIIDSLNYIRGLRYLNKTRLLTKPNYSALMLKQSERSKVAIVFAGGGYSSVCTLPEDLPVSVALHKKGLTVFSFAYPVKDKAITANETLKSFIKFLVNNQDKLNIDMEDYIVVSFSAGAHLAASIATDNLGMRNINLPNPKFLGLIYPVITMGESTHIGTRNNLLGENPTFEDIEKHSIELHVDEYFPNVYMWQCENDNVVPFKNSLLLKEALEKNNIDHIFHSYESDVHGWGIATNTPAEGWVDELFNYYLTLVNNKNI